MSIITAPTPRKFPARIVNSSTPTGPKLTEPLTPAGPVTASTPGRRSQTRVWELTFDIGADRLEILYAYLDRSDPDAEAIKVYYFPWGRPR